MTERQTCKVLKRQGEGCVGGIIGRNMTAIGNGAVSSKIISNFAYYVFRLPRPNCAFVMAFAFCPVHIKQTI